VSVAAEPSALLVTIETLLTVYRTRRCARNAYTACVARRQEASVPRTAICECRHDCVDCAAVRLEAARREINRYLVAGLSGAERTDCTSCFRRCRFPRSFKRNTAGVGLVTQTSSVSAVENRLKLPRGFDSRRALTAQLLIARVRRDIANERNSYRTQCPASVDQL